MHPFNSEIFWTAISELRKRSGTRPPLVHCITNYVAANDSANALLAAGAKPCMSDSPDECAEFTEKADALLLNMGTYSREKELAMLRSGKAANDKHIPVIFDPVGISASEFRQKSFEMLSKKIRFSVIKGNLSEMCCIAGVGVGYNSGSKAHFCEYIVKTAAQRLGCIAVLTGSIDFISDGETTLYMKNGSPHLSAVTGTGCIAGAVIAAFSTAAHNDTAALCGLGLVNLCGEIAAESFHGTASYRTELIDLMSQITREQISSRLNVHQYKEEDLW